MRLSNILLSAQPILLITAFFTISTNVYASDQWISDIDRKYQHEYPDLFQSTMKVKKDLSSWAGDSEILENSSVVLQEILNSNPEFAPAYVQAARLYSKLGNLPGGKVSDEALQAMEKLLQAALQIEPSYGYAYTLMGYTYLQINNLDEAERFLELAEGTGTGYPLLKHEKAKVLLARGNLLEAMEIAKAGYQEYQDQPDIALAYVETIISCARKSEGGADLADTWYKKAIELKPEMAWPLGNYASFLFYVRHDYDLAAEYAEKALEIMDYGMGRFILAAAYYGKWIELDETPGKKDEALAYFQKAISIYPDTDEHMKSFMRNRKLFKIYAKLNNYSIKAKNAKQDLELGIITQEKHDELVSSPDNIYAQ